MNRPDFNAPQNDYEVEKPESYIKKPYTEHEMREKVSEIQQRFAKKVDKWADVVQVAQYQTPEKLRVEGETWTDNKGKRWIKKDGISQSIAPLDAARMPIWCPECSHPMNHRFDRKMYYLRGRCFSCNIEWEGKMRLNGTWAEFERRMLRANERAKIKDIIDQHIDYIKNFSIPMSYSEDGSFEKFGSLKEYEPLFEKIEADIILMQSRLAEMDLEDQREAAKLQEETQ